MQNLYRIINGSSIAVFRMAFGLFMMWEIGYLWNINFVEVFLVTPHVQFPYEFLSFLKPLPKLLLDILLLFLMACAFFIAIGRYYRFAIISFFIGFSYLFFLDKAYYNNHLYLVCLLSFLLIFIPADNTLAFAKKSKTKTPTQYWHLLILRLQICVVYFFGGIAKWNPDWLQNKQPAIAFMKAKADQNMLLADALQSDLMINFIVYGGLLFDLLIGFLLFFPKSRKIAILLAVVFNLTNAWLFDDINIFPFLMIAALVLFFKAESFAAYVKEKLFKNMSDQVLGEAAPTMKRAMLSLFLLYFAFQFLMPLRHFLYQGNTEWTGHGQRFAWRMKIQHRSIESMEFKALDVQKKIIYPVDFRSYAMNRDQINNLAYDPYAVVQFAKFLKQHCIENKGMSEVQIKSSILVSFNGRKPQEMFSKQTDVSSLQPSGFDTTAWVLPLAEALKEKNE